MEFPNIDITTIILATSTITLVFVTGYYAFQTRKTVKVLEKTAELSIRPHLKGTFNHLGIGAGDLLIKNIGNGPANKIKLTYWIDGKDETKRDWTKSLLMQNAYDEFFIPKNESEHEITVVYFKNNQTTIKIKGKYYDVLDKKYEIDDSIDITAYVNQLEKTEIVYKDSDEELSSNVKKISDSLDNIKNEVHSLRRMFERRSN